MQERVKKTLLVMFFLTAILYGYSVFSNNSYYANITSTLNAGVCMVFIIISLKFIKHPEKQIYMFIAIYSLTWFLGDFVWMIYENMYPDAKILETVCDIIYISSSAIITVVAVFLILTNLRSIDKKRLFMDFIATSICVYYIIRALISVIFTNIPFSLTNINSGTASLLFDVFLTVILILIGATFDIKRIKKSMLVNIVAIFIFAMIDIVYIYQELIGVYESNSILDWCYVIPIGMFVWAIILEENGYLEDLTKELIPEEENRRKFNIGSNYTITLVFLSILIIDLILHKFKFISVNDAINILTFMIIYLVLNMNYESLLKNKETLKYHITVNEELEYKVHERTKELENSNEKLKTMLNTDFLTKLGSRKHIIDILEEYENEKFDCNLVVFAIDIIGFKNINYIFGYKFGDLVLQEMGRRLERTFLSDKIFRIDSNEFIVLMKDKSYTDEDLEDMGKTISNLTKDFKVEENKKVSINVAIGCVRCERKTDKSTNLIKNAEYACKEVKKNYNSTYNYRLYDEQLEEKITRSTNIESLLKNINYDDEFTLNYQPQFTTDGKQLIGMESLLRWNNPSLGFVSPGEFIPIAESSETIVKIVSWTLKKSIDTIKYWNEKYDMDLKIAVNISPKYLDSENFLDEVRNLIVKNDINPKWLDFEITEMTVMSIGKSVTSLFEQINEMGITISIDDFGTGYSSLSYIKSFKVDKLKIAKELIDNITTDVNEKMIVNAIIMMAKGLNLLTIAEGVEDVEQKDVLENLECNQIQGYFYGRPVPKDDFEEKYLKNMKIV